MINKLFFFAAEFKPPELCQSQVLREIKKVFTYLSLLPK